MRPWMRPFTVETSRMMDSAVTLLPEPDSPTMAKRLPRTEVEGDVVDDGAPALHAKGGREAANGQDRALHRLRPRP